MSRSATLNSRTAFERTASGGSITKVVIAMARSIGSVVRRAHARYRQRRKARATYDALRHLDDRMLRDLGFDRSEITSVAAEISGTAARTRVRLLLMSHNSP